jgi:D-sedoheptulose 7-phosphate isomerase
MATPDSASLSSLALREVEDHQRVLENFHGCIPRITEIAQAVIAALEEDHKIIFFGNGGSAADAQHLAAELSVRYRLNRVALPGLALSTDTSVLTACGNDFGFETIYSRQVEALARQGDVVIGITTSGNSANVLLGLKKAREQGCVTVAFTGGTGGQVIGMVEYSLVIPSDVTARIQECHILAGHILCEMIDVHWQGL